MLNITVRCSTTVYCYTLCPKKSMWRYLFEHNSNIHCPIIIIFGTVVTENKSYWIGISFFHLTYFVHHHYLGNHTTWKFANSSHPWHHPAAAAENTWLHRSGPLAAKQPRPKPCWLQDLGVMQQHVYERRINNVDELKQRLIAVWDGMQHWLGCRWMAKATQSMCACRGSTVRTFFMIFCWIERTRV